MKRDITTDTTERQDYKDNHNLEEIKFPEDTRFINDESGRKRKSEKTHDK